MFNFFLNREKNSQFYVIKNESKIHKFESTNFIET